MTDKDRELSIFLADVFTILAIFSHVFAVSISSVDNPPWAAIKGIAALFVLTSVYFMGRRHQREE